MRKPEDALIDEYKVNSNSAICTAARLVGYVAKVTTMAAF